MNIEVKQQGDIQIMHCGGSLDADTVAAFKKVAYDLVGTGATRFVVDCSDLTFIDSMGLGVLISLLRRVRQRDGDVKVAALSAGQRRRTALAVLLIRRAELWLLDEPHAGLDPDGRGELDALIRLAATSGVTVMLASHDLDRSRDLADREITVVGGAVVEAA